MTNLAIYLIVCLISTQPAKQ